MEQTIVLFLILKRLLGAFILMIATSFLCFYFIYFSKGSVVFANSPQSVSQGIRQQIEQNLNLNQPPLTQYTHWLLQALKGNLSYSLVSGEKVSSILIEKSFNTLILGITSFIALILLSSFLAIISVIYRNKWPDKVITILSMGIFAIPTFALCLILILLFSVLLQWFPSSGANDIGMEDSISNFIWHLILPSSVLILSHLAVFVRFIRTSLIETLNQNFIECAFGRGLSKARIYFHFIPKYTLYPVLSYFGACFVSFLGGTYVAEKVFNYGGIGNLIIDSIIFKDYPVILPLIALSVFLVVFVNLVIEIILECIDPRPTLENANV